MNWLSPIYFLIASVWYCLFQTSSISFDNEPSIVIDTVEYSSLNEVFFPYKGKAVYMDFWGSWCRPCLEMMPGSVALQKKMAGDDVVFLFLAVNDQKERWISTIKRLGITGHHVFLSPALGQKAKDRFGITAFPHYAILNADGSTAYVMALDPEFPELPKILQEAANHK